LFRNFLEKVRSPSIFPSSGTNTVVGLSHIDEWYYRPFIWSEPAGMSELPVDSARETGEWYATAINESGMIGGHVIDGGGYYPYYWTSKDDAPVAMTMPASFPYGESYGLNESGQIVGGMFNSNDEDHAFIFDTTNGVVDLNDRIGAGTGWQLLTAVDINDLGQITGIGELNGATRAFLLTPNADADADGDIDGSDIAALVQEIGATACNGGCSCDFNDDNAVTIIDVFLQAMVFGHTS
jgi:probable HAF family extracellular repeat protein